MQFKKLAAVAGSAIMAGMSLAAPVLATTVTELGNVADMVTVTDSTVSFPIFIIGENALPADVAGAIGVGVNMASNAKTTQTVTTQISGESVTGGAKIATSGIFLTPYSNPQNVKGILTTSDIASLLGTGTYSSSSGGSYQYKQYLYLLGDSTNSNPAKIKYERPTTENSPRIAFKTPASSKLYTYKLTFSTPVSLSGVTGTTDLQNIIQGTTVNMLGKDFVISDCAYTGSSDAISSITLLGGRNVVTIETGTPQTVTIDTKDYTVTLTGVAAQTVGTSTYYSAIGDINGESFTLRAGQTKTLSDGTLIAAIKVFQGKTGAADYATIAIGADKVTLTSAGTVTKGTTVVPELTSTITASTSGGWSVLKLDYTPSVDAWLSAGSKITEPFASTFDIKFNSIIPDFTDATNRQTITISPSGYNMLLTYKNAADAEKQMYTLYYSTSCSGNWCWASAGAGSPTYQDNNWRDVVFDEGQNISAVEQDYFVIEKGGFSHTLQFTSYTNATKTYTFTDESGNTITAVGSTGVSNDTADLIVDGNTYKVYLLDGLKKIIHVDLDGDSTIANIASTYTGLFAGKGTYTGREYSHLVPKLITTGQGGLYFYRGMQTGQVSASGLTPNIGIVPLNITNSTNTTGSVTVIGESSALATIYNGTINNITGDSTTGYMDLVVNCSATFSCSAGLGTSVTGIRGSPGFVLVEEALQGGTTHHWLYLPVMWDSTNSRTYVSTTLYSDDTNYADNAILGTSTQYKGMTTYGTLADHLSSTLGGSASISYPDVFTYGNLYVLTPTGVITSGGAGGVVTTEVVLPITSDVVKLDSEVTSSDEANYDFVIVGGPCVNEYAARALDKTFPACGASSGIPENAGLIKLVADKFATGKTALLIAGWEWQDTDLACRIVQTGFPGATDAQKASDELTVTGTVASPSYA